MHTFIQITYLLCVSMLFSTGFQPNGEAPISSTDKSLTSNDFEKFSPPRRLRTDEIPILSMTLDSPQEMLLKLVSLWIFTNLSKTKCASIIVQY